MFVEHVCACKRRLMATLCFPDVGIERRPPKKNERRLFVNKWLCHCQLSCFIGGRKLRGKYIISAWRTYRMLQTDIVWRQSPTPIRRVTSISDYEMQAIQ